jgi:hypothetical protein
MAVVKRLKTLDGKDFTIPKEVYYILKEGLNRVNQKLDCPFIITGSVGSGKTNLELGMGGVWQEVFLKKPFTLDNIHFRAEVISQETNRDDNFKEFIGFDEAIQGGSSRDGITKIGNVLRKTLITKRYKGHCLVACVDSLKELNDKIIERAMCWFHIHYHRQRNGRYRKGIIKIFSSQQALIVYQDLKDKKVIKTEDHYIWKQNRIQITCMNYENLWFTEDDYNKKKTEETNLIDVDDKISWNQEKMLAFHYWSKEYKHKEIVDLTSCTIDQIKGWSAKDFKKVVGVQST